jgi:hypothetical protein
MEPAIGALAGCSPAGVHDRGDNCHRLGAGHPGNLRLMIVGELVPKNFCTALSAADGQTLVIRFQVGFTAVFRPL